jgi:hypothetical protein
MGQAVAGKRTMSTVVVLARDSKVSAEGDLTWKQQSAIESMRKEQPTSQI